MKTLLATATFLVLILVLPQAVWAGGRGHGRHHGPRNAGPQQEAGPDRNGDGVVSTYEQILWDREQRFNRARGGR